MKTTQLFLQSLFPLPQRIQQMIQAQAFLLLSQKNINPSFSHPSSSLLNNNTSSPPLNKNKHTLIKCLQYPTYQEAKQNEIKLTSLSNAFYLQIYKKTIKQLVQKNTWCLIIQMQVPLVSLKQKLNMNRNDEIKVFNQNELILVINCMNILYSKYMGQTTSRYRQYICNQRVSINRLLDNIFVTQNGLIKLSLPQLFYQSSANHISKNSNQNDGNKNNHNNNKDVLKLSLMLMNILGLLTQYQQKQNSSFSSLSLLLLIKEDIFILKNKIEDNLKVDKFCMKQLKNYLLVKIDDAITCNGNKNNKKYLLNQKKQKASMYQNKLNKQQLQFKQQITQQQQRQNFPTIKFTKRPNQSILNKRMNQNYNLSKQHSQQHSNNKNNDKNTTNNKNNNNQLLSVKLTTLNDLLINQKIVQSFQQDQYSYILQSNNTSPSRMSPFNHLNKNHYIKGGTNSRLGLGLSNLLLLSQSRHKNNSDNFYYQKQQQKDQQQFKFKQSPSPITKNKFQSPSRSPQSLIQSQSHVIPQQLSNSYDFQQQHNLNQQYQQQNQQNRKQSHISRSRSNSHTSNLQQDANSIIIQVQEQQIQNQNINDNCYVQGESSYFNSQLVQLSFSRGGMDQVEENYEGGEDEKVFMENYQFMKNWINLRPGDNKDTIKQDNHELIEIVDQQQGTIYYGQVKNNMKQGKGKIIYHDQGFFEGQWKNNNITGFGRLFYPSKKLAYAGYWHHGCFHGPGLVLNQTIQPMTQQNPFDFTDLSNLGRTWISYRGNFNMDVRQGYGVVKLSNGDSISGVWQGNCINGQGEYVKKDGSQIKAMWKMNKLVKIIGQSQTN